VDSQTAQKMRLARKARMKEKYGSGDLSDDEKRLLTELNNSVNELCSLSYSHAFIRNLNPMHNCWIQKF